MNYYAGSLIVCGCLGAVAAIGAGCGGIVDNSGGGGPSSAGAPNTPSTAGAPGSVPGPAAAGAPSSAPGPAAAGAPSSAPSPAAAGAPSSAPSPAAAGAPSGTGTPGSAGALGSAGSVATGVVLLPVDPTGFVALPKLGIRGAWYGYGDGQGSDGTVASSDCVLKGMHMATDCSLITAPPFGYFPQATPGKMCTSGMAAKVIAGSVGCVAPATNCPDYANLYGAGIGLDLNNAGSDGGTSKHPFNATAAGIVGISFDLDAVPLSRVRVEFPTLGTESTPAMWKPGTSNLSPLVAGHNVLLFADVASPTFVKPAIPFDRSKLLSIQFHVPTNTSASAMYSFCISNLAVVTGP